MNAIQLADYPYRSKDVPLSQLFVDHVRYQRPLNERFVKKLVANFDMGAVGAISVHQRPGGLYVIIDGQHRVAALKIVFTDRPGMKVPCLVYEGLSTAEEAKLFHLLNTDLLLRTGDKFKSRLEYADPQALDIARIVEAAGYSLDTEGRNRGARNIKAIKALETIHRTGGGDHLSRVLNTIRAAWPDDEKATADYCLLGIHALWMRYQRAPEFSLAILLSVLQTVSVNQVLQKAAAFRETGAQTRGTAFAQAIVLIYNKRRSRNRLPDLK